MKASRPAPQGPAVTLGSLWWMFLRIACTSFGGYMAMISVMRHVVVERRKLMSDQDVLDGLTLASMLPGPVAINVVAYAGHRLRGVPGAAVCVCASVLPGFLLMLALSAAYLRWGQMPAAGKAFMGLMPAVAAVVAASAWNLGCKALSGWRETALAVVAAAALLGLGGMYLSFVIICVAALLGWCWFRGRTDSAHTVRSTHSARVVEPVMETVTEPVTEPEDAGGAGEPLPRPPIRSNLLAIAASPQWVVPFMTVDPHLLLKLFFTFAAMSMLLFGGAYVFVPLLEQSVVDGHGWVTQREFADAVAMAQLMPGPAVISVVFVGFKAAGPAGAAAAAAGIFSPSVVLMILCKRLFDRLKASAACGAAMRGVRAAVVGMVFAAAATIARAAPVGWVSVLLFLSALVLLLRCRVDAIWLMPPAALAGFLAY